jgi:hypothetical protein
MQTSIEWFYDQITRTYWDYMTTERQNELFEQAKEMHKAERETLYTEEQVREVIGKAQLLNHNDEFAFTEEYLIQSLKESKK